MASSAEERRGLRSEGWSKLDRSRGKNRTAGSAGELPAGGGWQEQNWSLWGQLRWL